MYQNVTTGAFAPASAKSDSKRNSCVSGHYGYWVQVHSDYVEMFDGDHCAAVLLWVLEFATNGEIRRMERAEQSGEPWIEASISALSEDTIGLYSRRSIDDRMAWFKQLGIVESRSSRLGQVNKYLLNGALVSSFLESRKVFRRDDPYPPEPVRKIAHEDEASCAATCAATCAKTTHEGPVLNLKEEELRKKKEEYPHTPTKTDSDLYVEPAHARRVLENTRGLKKLSTKERQLFEEGFRAKMTEEQVREAGERFAAWAKTLASPLRSWAAVFLKDPQRWCSRSPGDAGAILEQALPPLDTPSAEIVSSAPEVSALQKQDILTKWNGATGESLQWSDFSPAEIRKIEAAVAEFPPDKWLPAFERYAVIRDGHDPSREIGWLNFDWVVCKGWGKLTRGDKMQYLMAPEGKGTAKKKSVTEELMEKIKRGEIVV